MKTVSRTMSTVIATTALVSCQPGAGDRSDNALRTPADSLLARSIEFHDPDGVWGSRALEYRWTGTDAGDSVRVDGTITIDPASDSFVFSGDYRGDSLVYEAFGDSLRVRVNGADATDLAVRRALRLDREDGLFWRNYYEFLAGLPMKLRDPGTRLGTEIGRERFNEIERSVIRVTYDAETGGDTWYFYFDSDTAELVGARFHHDEAAGDGEYLIFEGLTDGAVRVPRVRRWHLNTDSTYLGADDILGVRDLSGA